jgi:hypothetical protein
MMAQRINSVTQVIWSRTVSSGSGAPALPSASTNPNTMAIVIDGISASDCTVGGGTTRVGCISNGVTWAAMSGTSTVVNAPLIGTGVIIDASTNGGNGYASAPSITLSGGTCSVSPVINAAVPTSAGAAIFTMENPGNCTVSPTAIISGGSPSVAATLVLALQNASVNVSSSGVLSGVVTSGSGHPVLDKRANLYAPQLASPILTGNLPDGTVSFNGYPNLAILCNNNSPAIAFYYNQPSFIISPNCGNDVVSFRPNGSSIDLAQFTTSISSPFVVTSVTNNNIGFYPQTNGYQSSGTILSAPQNAGLVWYNNNSGPLVGMGGSFGGGYTGTGACALSTTYLISGTPDTCTVSAPGTPASGQVTITLHDNGGIYSVAPKTTLSGFTTGSGAFLQLYINNNLSQSGSLWQGISSPGIFKWHYSAGALSGTDLWTLDTNGNMTATTYNSINSCAAFAAGTPPTTAIGACAVANSSSGVFSCPANANVSGGTCTITNTSATSISSILLTQDTAANLQINIVHSTSINCNSTITAPLITSKGSGSFTVTLPDVTTFPVCYSFFIIN